jgi:hypothetical protein
MQSAKQRLPGASNVYVMKYVSTTEIPSRDLNHGNLEGIRIPDFRLGVDLGFLLLPKSGFQISEILGSTWISDSKKADSRLPHMGGLGTFPGYKEAKVPLAT